MNMTLIFQTFDIDQQIYYRMNNPEYLPTELIYNYDNKLNQTWNLKEYRTPKESFDPLLQVKKRQWEKQKKGQPNKGYVTKRGFYMDYSLKVAKEIPGANTHNDNDAWSFKKEAAISKHRTMDPKLIKYTYLERIEMEQKNRKSPGICSYSLQKSLKQKDAQVQVLKKKKYSVGEKKFFYEDVEHVSEKIPGAGNYNPHDEMIKIRKNKTNHKEWVKKHDFQMKRDSKRLSLVPAPGTYTPMNATITTFDSLSKSPKSPKFEGFGKDARFTYTRPEKKKIKQLRPSPNSYNTTIEWKGKGSPKNTRGWQAAISKGFETLNIYK